MNEFLVPVGLVGDTEIAHEIALASKNERSMAAGARAVDQALIQFKVAGTEFNNSDNRVVLAKRLMGIYAINPETFGYITATDKSSQEPNELSMLIDSSVVIRHGGLPILEDEYSVAHKITVEKLDSSAALIEKVALALLYSPPSIDFLNDFGLTIMKDGNQIEIVINLLYGVERYGNIVAEQTNKNKFDVDMKIVKEFTAKAAELQSIFDAIVSGEAALYSSKISGETIS